MKKIITCLLAIFGLTSACGQKSYENAYEVDVFQTKSGKTVKFHALMHASIRIEFDGKEIEIDPVLKLREKTIDFSDMPKADYIFVTHEHMDHFDKGAISQLTGENTVLRCLATTASIAMEKSSGLSVTTDYISSRLRRAWQC